MQRILLNNGKSRVLALEHCCDDSGQSTLPQNIEIRFRVGDFGFPVNGQQVWKPVFNGVEVLKNKYVQVFRNGLVQFPNDLDEGFEINHHDGTIKFHPALKKDIDKKGEAIIIRIQPQEIWTIIQSGRGRVQIFAKQFSKKFE